MKIIEEQLLNLADEKYAAFSAKLTPNVDLSLFIGVRVPVIRSLAKKIKDEEYIPSFLNELPHKYYDENMLHGCLLMQIKDYNDCLNLVNRFLPYVDNWAVCDIMSPKCFSKNKDKLLSEIKKWLKSKHTYTIRFGIEMLMSHYLDKEFKPEYLQLVSKIRSKEYYVNMMIAWYFATALTKQYDEAIKVIENKLLDDWTHNKTIQKAIESYRISDSQKIYLRSLKIK